GAGERRSGNHAGSREWLPRASSRALGRRQPPSSRSRRRGAQEALGRDPGTRTQRQAPCEPQRGSMSGEPRLADQDVPPSRIAAYIEAPRRGPANERPKNYSVEDGARRSEARSVVVPGEEPNSVSCRDVLPVAAALANDGQWRVGAELQRRRRAAVRQGTLANRFAFAADFKAEADARRISKSLRRAITDEREVFDP